MKRKLLWLLPVLWVLPNTASAQDYEHLNISSGLNADVIANGVGSASASTNFAVDNANYSFMAADFQATASSVPPAYALPVSGIINSIPTPGLTFQLADYSGSNSLRIPTANISSTLTFTNQVSAAKLYLLATSGSGTATITGTITFTDNTTQAIASSVIPDWFFSNALPVAAWGFGRVNRLTNVMENPANDPRLYQLAINILPINQPKQIASIEFTKTSTAEGVLNIFAITAELLGECPSPVDVTAASMPDSGIVSWSAPALIPAVGYEYYYSTSSTPPAVGTTPSGSVAVGTNTVTIDELATGQQYYVWVRSSCGDTDKGPWVMTTFTTGQITTTYTAGDISTLYNTAPTITSTTTCPGILSVTVPAGYEIASVSTAYTMTTASNGFMSEQRSVLVCTTTNTTEAAVSAGVGATGGTMTYSRTGLDIADGATGTVNFELRAWRTYGTSGCNLIYNKVDNNSWTVTVTYQPVCTPPAPPTAVSQAVCANSTIAELEITGIDGATFNFYPSATADEPLETTDITEETTYYVTQTANNCESERIPVAVTINTVPAPTVDTTQDFCSGAIASGLTAEGETGNTIIWSLTPNGEQLAADTPLTTGTYYVWQVSGDCQSAITDVVVFINNLPEPVVNQNQEVCEGSTIDVLTADGTVGADIIWSLTEGGAALPENTVLTNGTYFVTQTMNGCTSTAEAVTVTVTAVPEAPTGNELQNFTQGETIADLEVTTEIGYTVNWYIYNDMGILVTVEPTAVLEDGDTYYAAQAMGECESELLAITVNEILSVSQFTIEGLRVYPNPADDVITISSKEAISGVKIYNMLGQLVLTANPGTDAAQINIAQIDAGTYAAEVTANGQKEVVKIIKK